jgi:hypothetical protein
MDKKTISLIEYCAYHMRLFTPYDTFRNWKNFLRVITKFNANITNEFNLHDYADFKEYLLDDGYSNNTIVGFTDKLKALLRAIGREGYIITNDLPLMTHISDEPTGIYLNTEELGRLQKLKLEGTFDIIRDRFLIGCYTAMRFSDYSRVGYNNIIGNNIEVLHKKTNIKVLVPIHPVVKAIFKKYRNTLPQCPSNWYVNKTLPAIAARARINDKVTIERRTTHGIKTDLFLKHELVHTHTARRTGATNMYLAGIPTFRIMLITGHKTEESFFKYIRIERKENADVLATHPFFQ